MKSAKKEVVWSKSFWAFYEYGIGTSIDKQKAFDWYSESATGVYKAGK